MFLFRKLLPAKEILVNAADNLIRDPSMDTIRVEIDTAKSRISASWRAESAKGSRRGISVLLILKS